MTSGSSATPPKRNMLSALSVFTDRRTLVMLALGFSAGLPFFLIFDTLSAWLRVAGLTLEVIGYFSLATLCYSFKFLWAPLIDRVRIPVITNWLGHRRSWMLLCQALVMLGLWLVAGTNPISGLPRMAAFAVFVGFASATQDIVLDAWRIEAAEVNMQGALAAAYTWGYRGAMVTAGAAPLLLAEAYSWNFSYAVMAALMSIGLLATLAAPREVQHQIRSMNVEGMRAAPTMELVEWCARFVLLLVGALLVGSGLAANASALDWLLRSSGMPGLGQAAIAAWRSTSGVWFQLLSVLAGFAIILIAARPIPGVRTRPGVYLATALGEPFTDFFHRHQGTAGIILALICLYRISDFVLNIMNPFYLDVGFTLVELAEVRKIFGVVAAMLGALAGGLAVARLGLMAALLIGAFAGPLSNLIFMWLAVQGHSVPALFVAIGVDNTVGGFAGTCLIAYMSSLTSAGFTATQYALFSSLYALPGKLVASQSGRIVEAAAHSAAGGGAFSMLTGMFTNLPPESFGKAMEKSGVSPAALAAGYSVFFIYSTVIGVFAVVLAFMVAAKEKKRTAQEPVPAVETPTTAKSNLT
jgi:MFS transporter, PAT family, beta-lactamase induction signal transducer AmpG